MKTETKVPVILKVKVPDRTHPLKVTIDGPAKTVVRLLRDWRRCPNRIRQQVTVLDPTIKLLDVLPVRCTNREKVKSND